jgi:hypothetical protein
MTVWNVVVVPNDRCRLTRICELDSPGASFTQMLTVYRDPLHSLPAALMAAPSNAACRPVVSRL